MPTGIQWTDDVWNPITGCDRISDGCDHCYALLHVAGLAAEQLAREDAEAGRD